MSATILALGTAVPAESTAQSAMAELCMPMCCNTAAQGRLLGELYRRSRIKSRHSVLLTGGNGHGPWHSFYQPRRDEDDAGPTTKRRMEQYAEHAAPLAADAARQALHRAQIDAGRIDHLVTVSCTGFVAPGIDVKLIGKLGLRGDVSRTHIGFMGCHGAFNGLRIGSALTDHKFYTLMCAVELCSLHLAYGWDRKRLVSNALFADGAAAAVLGPQPAATSGARPWRLVANGSMVLPDSEDAMTWRVNDHGFAMTLSPRVPQLIREQLRKWLSAWLSRHDLSLDAVGSWAVHPGGPRILRAVAEALDLSENALDESHAVLANYGNMSSPTILFIMERLRKRRAALPCVALGFGPGLVVEAMLLA